MTVETVSNTICTLGEGPLWHPSLGQFFWFDILGKRLYTLANGEEKHWQFDEYVSAAGWVDDRQLMIASQSMLFLFNIETGESQPMAALEADTPGNRSNDGRADPQGGFWIGTMAIDHEDGAGAIWRWYRGELRKLHEGITVSNSICFSPEGDTVFWADTRQRQIMRQPLDAEGWPSGDAEVHIDLTGDRLNPDGSVVDASGNLWNAQWGASRVACYGRDGAFIEAIDFPASQTSCPAFGGADLATLYVTSAATGKEDEAEAGKTFAVQVGATGQAEHRVIL